MVSPGAAGSADAKGSTKCCSLVDGHRPFVDDISLQAFVDAAPEMDVRWNHLYTVPDNNTTPSNVNGTDFGYVDVAGGKVVHTFQVYNTGDAALNLTGTPLVKLEYDTADFSVTVLPTSPVAAAGGYTEFEVTFDPTMAGIRNATVSIANDDPDENPYNFVLQGIGSVPTAPDMQVRDDTGTWLIPNGDQSPSPTDGTDFGSVDINGVQVSHWFQVHNVGTAGLNLTGDPHVVWHLGDTSDFTLNIQPASPVVAGGLARFEVIFNPTAVGLHAVVLSIANDDSDSNPYTFVLQGVGVDPLAPEIEVRNYNGTAIILDEDKTPSSYAGTDFGPVNLVGGSVTHTFTIFNLNPVSGRTLNLTGNPLVAIGGPNSSDFIVKTLPASPIPAGEGSTEFQIVFDPLGMGDRFALVTITNDDSDENPYNFLIKGYAPDPCREPFLVTPATPANVQSSDGTYRDKIRTTWAAAACATSYKVFRSTGDAGGPYDDYLGETPDLAWDHPVNDITLRWFKVFACNSVGCSLDGAIDSLGGFATGMPEMEVRNFANGVVVVDNDTTPTTSEGTDFGASDVTTGAVAHGFLIWNFGAGTLNLTGNPRVVLSGANPADFIVNMQPPAVAMANSNPVQFAITFNPTAPGARTATVSIANDDADENPYNFSVQGLGINLPPRVGNITLANPNPTTASPVRFNISFTEAVSGVDIADFSLTTSGFTVRPVIIGVSGTGSTRVVSVASGAGVGTIRLNVIDNDTIKDLMGMPLGGTGPGNGAYLIGPKYTLDRNNIFTSTALYDGWLLESGEFTNVGSSLNAAGNLIIGDDALDRQYRSLVSFSTASLPDNAVIVRVTLKIRRAAVVGTNPFTTHAPLLADIQKGFFGVLPNLQASDFQVAASKPGAGSFALVAGTTDQYQLLLDKTNFSYINKLGTTQFRLRFYKDDNDDRGADFAAFYAGDSLTAFYRPTLIVEYTLP